MTITLITDLVTSAEVLLYHGKKMGALADKAGTRIYADDMLEEVMNTIIEFILANAPSTVSENLLKSTIKRLCRDELNNRLHEDGRLKNWTQLDVMDKEYLFKLLETKVEGEEPTKSLIIINNTKEY